MNGKKLQSSIHLGRHGEDYGNWMPKSWLYLVRGLGIALVILSIMCFVMFHLPLLGILCILLFIGILFVIRWMKWVRRQYAFGQGGIMDKVHQAVITFLDFDGHGTVLELGCGSGPLSIRAALNWPRAKIVGVGGWESSYNYSQAMCERNAKLEGVESQCTFMKANVKNLDFEDETFDAVIANFIFHTVSTEDKQKIMLEGLRVLKKGGVFALNDTRMRDNDYIKGIANKLKNMGYEDVRVVDTSKYVCRSKKEAKSLMLEGSCMLVGRK